MGSIELRKRLINAARGKLPLDLILRDVKVMNLFTERIEPGAIGILDGRIVTTQADGLSAAREVDGKGRFALPGFIDAHVHIDSTLMTPERIAELILPHGTTVMLADPMESANVGGFAGLRALIGDTTKLPYHLWIEVSSRVPTAPGLETTGGELTLEDVKQILKWKQCISLGELDPSKVLGLQDEYLAKVEAANALGKIANGHAAGLTGRDLEAYALGGLADDHEAVDFAEAIERLELGLSLFVREGSTERNLRPILKGFVEVGLDMRHLMFCTDDKHPDDILKEGHVDLMVNQAISMGVDPIKAVQMASLNSAEHFRIDHLVGSLSSGRWADIILTEKLEPIVPDVVFTKGKMVVRNGEMIVDIPSRSYPKWFSNTVKVRRGKRGGDFKLIANGEDVHVRVIDLYPDQIINRQTEAILPVRNGEVSVDVENDILKLAVVERYDKNGNIGIAFVRGFGLKQGALASSVAHDHHNIIVAGVDDDDMALCVREIERMQGGLVIAAKGKILGSLPLPLGGLMSKKSVKEVIHRLEKLTKISHELGGKLPAPFMTISFISLPTVPELGLTDMGLVDVRRHKLIQTIIQ